MATASTGPAVIQPLSPAKIAVNDPASIITAVTAIGAVVLNAWPGSTGLPANTPQVVAVIAAALAVTLIWVKHMLSAAAVAAGLAVAPTAPQAAAQTDEQAKALTDLEKAVQAAMDAGVIPPWAPAPVSAYPSAGVPIQP